MLFTIIIWLPSSTLLDCGTRYFFNLYIFYGHDLVKQLANANASVRFTGASVFTYHVHDPERPSSTVTDGRVSTDQSVVTLQRLALELADEVAAGAGAGGNAIVAARCKALSAKHFSPEAAVRQIVAALRIWALV